MQRSSQQNHESINPIASVVPGLNSEIPVGNVSRRYDMATIQKAVEIASRMQEEHKETLATEEIEAIATEVGIETRFIRQALEIAAAEISQKNLPTPLTLQDRLLVFGLPFLYAILFILVDAFGPQGYSSSQVPILLVLVFPVLITIFAVANLRRASLGTLAGLMMGVGMFVAYLVISIKMIGKTNSVPSLWVIAFFAFMLVAYTGGGALVGKLTAVLRYKVRHWLATRK